MLRTLYNNKVDNLGDKKDKILVDTPIFIKLTE